MFRRGGGGEDEGPGVEVNKFKFRQKMVFLKKVLNLPGKKPGVDAAGLLLRFGVSHLKKSHISLTKHLWWSWEMELKVNGCFKN